MTSAMPNDLGSKALRVKRHSRKGLWTDVVLSHGIWIAAGFSAILNLFQLGLPLYSLQIFDRVLPTDSLPTLVTLSLLIVGLIFCSVFIDASRSLILERLAQRVDLALHRRATSAALNGNTSGLTVLKDIETIRSFIMSPLACAAFDGPWSIAFIIAMFFLHPLLGWLTIIACVLMFFMGIVAYLATDGSRVQSATIMNIGRNILDEARQSTDAVSAMGMRPRLLLHLIRLRRHYLHFGQVGAGRQVWIDAASRGLRSVMQVLVLALAAYLAISRGLETGAIVASSMLFARALAPVERLGSGSHILLSFLSAWRRASTLIKSTQPAITHLELPALQGLVVASDVSFRISGRERPILRQINIAVKPGQLLAIVGREGAGKSTLARLLVGAINPSHGTIRFDGSNIADFEPEALGQQVGFVSESTVLPTGSVAELISRGQIPDSVKIVRAAQLAGMHTSIQSLPSGYQTEVGEGRHLLSAGERQRLALARAFYGSPRILVLDEPTAHLDDSGETAFVEAVQELKRAGSTIVVISRLPGLLHLADQLIMLELGEIRLAADQDQMQRFLVPRLATSQEI